MAAQKQHPFQVNLLIHKGEEIKIYTRLLKWILSSGRYIVVFVELLVIVAFILRYKLDAELLDIQDKIKDEIPYVQSLKEDELLIKQVQFQLSTIRQTKEQASHFDQAMTKIAQLTPQTIHLVSLTLDRAQSFPKTKIIINGASPSNREISAYIKALKSDPAFSEITLTNISFQGQTQFTITGSLTLKGGSST